MTGIDVPSARQPGTPPPPIRTNDPAAEAAAAAAFIASDRRGVTVRE